MKVEILAAIKKDYSKFGLKQQSIDKLLTLIEANIAAMGTLDADKLTEAIDSNIKAYTPFVELIQSEVDARAAKKPAEPTPIPAQTSTDDGIQASLKALLEKVQSLEKDKLDTSRSETKKSLIEKATALSKKGGASNESLLAKAMRLVEFNDESTPEQISALAISEYNELHAGLLSEVSSVPSIPSRNLSDAEIEKQRTEAQKKSSEEYKKNSYI